MLEAVRAVVLVKMQSHLTVRPSSELMAALLQVASLPFKIVKLPVGNDVDTCILVGDRLIAGGEIDNAQARVAKGDTPICRNPGTVAIGATMMESSRGAGQRPG